MVCLFMRFIITSSLKRKLKENQPLLSKNHHFKFRIKNLIYKNRSISESDKLNLIKLEILKNVHKLENYNFNPIKNLGVIEKKILFKGYSKELAEFIGIILGDGNIYRYNLRITIHRDESKYKEHIKSLFSKLFGLEFYEYNYKNSKTLQLYRTSKNLIQLLKKLGLKEGNKIKNNIKVPYWISKNRSFAISCIRGLIDTDGYLHYHKRDKQISVGFTNLSESLIQDFMMITSGLGFSFVRSGKDIRLYRKQDVREFLRLINLVNDRHLIKYNYFLETNGAGL